MSNDNRATTKGEQEARQFNNTTPPTNNEPSRTKQRKSTDEPAPLSRATESSAYSSHSPCAFGPAFRGDCSDSQDLWYSSGHSRYSIHHPAHEEIRKGAKEIQVRERSNRACANHDQSKHYQSPAHTHTHTLGRIPTPTTTKTKGKKKKTQHHNELLQVQRTRRDARPSVPRRCFAGTSRQKHGGFRHTGFSVVIKVSHWQHEANRADTCECHTATSTSTKGNSTTQEEVQQHFGSPNRDSHSVQQGELTQGIMDIIHALGIRCPVVSIHFLAPGIHRWNDLVGTTLRVGSNKVGPHGISHPHGQTFVCRAAVTMP